MKWFSRPGTRASRIVLGSVLAVLALLPIRLRATDALDVDIERFARYLDALRVQAKIPGLSATILQDGAVRWEQGFGDADVERALQAHGLSYRKLDDATFMTSVADSIASDQIVGWFQGRMELGPRALGCRSILGNPANAAMKDHINACVKFREEFRPFAPAILAERAEEFFELNGCEAPYMVLVPDARPGVAARIPAVVHVDNTGRVQTVSKQLNPRFHALLEALDARTGIPVVLNTSFNVKGEPIVCTPGDAVRCFLNTDIDVLAINNYVVEKSC